MKSFKDNPQNRHRMRDRWKERFRSVWNKMNRGAQEISRMITSGHADEWRRHDKFQKNHDKGHHKFHKRH